MVMAIPSMVLPLTSAEPSLAQPDFDRANVPGIRISSLAIAEPATTWKRNCHGPANYNFKNRSTGFLRVVSFLFQDNNGCKLQPAGIIQISLKFAVFFTVFISFKFRSFFYPAEFILHLSAIMKMLYKFLLKNITY